MSEVTFDEYQLLINDTFVAIDEADTLRKKRVLYERLGRLIYNQSLLEELSNADTEVH